MSLLRQTSFAGGEIAPDLYGRTDIDSYPKSLRKSRNGIVAPSGNWQNRPGTKYVGECFGGGNPVRLIPFIFSNGQSFVLQFADRAIRIFQNGAPVSPVGSPAYDGATTYQTDAYVTYGGVVYHSKVIGANLGHQPDISPTWWEVKTTYDLTTGYLTPELSRLKFCQSGDTLFIAHPSHTLAALKRITNINWVLSTWAVTTPVPLPGSVVVDDLGTAYDQTGDGTHPSRVWIWTVTTIDAQGNESVGGAANVCTYVDTHAPGDGHAVGDVSVVCQPDKRGVVVSWTAAAGAISYRIYRGLLKSLVGPAPVFGFVGQAWGTSYVDAGKDPDYTQQPPTGYNPIAANNPACVGIFEQRLILANSASYPNRIWCSKAGDFHNFEPRQTPLDNDPLDFVPASTRFDEIRSIVPLRTLFLAGSNAQWTVNGDQEGTLTPKNIMARPQYYAGSSWLDPIPVGASYLFVQEFGDVVRDLGYTRNGPTYFGGYDGADLTVTSRHLFVSHSIVDWAYARSPFSVVWAVRDDGVMLGMTYVRDQGFVAWGWHDTQGVVENVCTIPEANEDAVYLVVKRTKADGSVHRYVERMATRWVTDGRLGVFLDAAVSYDGRNTTAVTMALSGQTPDWAANSLGILTASAATFSAGDVGSNIVLNPDDPTRPIRCNITAYTDTTHVTVQFLAPVPASLQGPPTTKWAWARTVFTGLDHLEGLVVNVLGDGFVAGTYTVTGGAITLPQPYAIVTAGLAYASEMELLDLFIPGAETRDNVKNVSKAAFEVANSRGIEAGPDFDHLYPAPDKPLAGAYDVAPPLYTGMVDVRIVSSWNQDGRMVLRQADPLPVTVLSATRLFEVGGSV